MFSNAAGVFASNNSTARVVQDSNEGLLLCGFLQLWTEIERRGIAVVFFGHQENQPHPVEDRCIEDYA